MLVAALWTNAIPPPVLPVLGMEIPLYPIGQIQCAISVLSGFNQVPVSTQRSKVVVVYFHFD